MKTNCIGAVFCAEFENKVCFVLLKIQFVKCRGGERYFHVTWNQCTLLVRSQTSWNQKIIHFYFHPEMQTTDRIRKETTEQYASQKRNLGHNAEEALCVDYNCKADRSTAKSGTFGGSSCMNRNLRHKLHFPLRQEPQTLRKLPTICGSINDGTPKHQKPCENR